MLNGWGLEVSGSFMEVRPPLAFLVLLALAQEPNLSLSRQALGSLIFGHLDPMKRGPQVRLVVKRLRCFLDLHERTRHILSLTDSMLSLSEPMAVDAEEISSDLNSLDRLDQISEPILRGHSSKFAEKYRQKIRGRIEVALHEIWRLLDAKTEVAEFVRICEKLRDNFLLSAPIRVFLCAGYKRLHRFEELTREIQSFDGEWLDAFGVCDRPDIGLLCEKLFEGGKI